MTKGTSIVSELADIRERQRQLALQSGDAGDDPLLDFYVRVMAKMLDAERCSIFIREPDSGKVWLKCGTALGRHGARRRLFKAPDPSPGEVQAFLAVSR